jgi:hypothetical protein
MGRQKNLLQIPAVGGSMARQGGKSIVQEILELLDQQREMLRSEKPITDEQALVYRERMSRIRDFVEQLGESRVEDWDRCESRSR